MKLNKLLLLGATSFLVCAVPVSVYTAGASANSPARAVNPASTSSSNMTMAEGRSVAVMSGTFVAAEKPTTGTARIVTENGHRYLELDAAFTTSNQGPDLHVLLDTPAKPPQTYQNLGSAINLGRLSNYSGAQRYPIPDSIKLGSFKSVVIWCRMANATFGYAPLRPSSNASAQ